MKRICTVVTIAMSLIFFSSSLSAQDNSEGIQFEHSDWKEAVEKAAKEGKVIFVDCYTTWCGPCKKLSNEVFPQKKVGDYFNSNFINVKIDCEKGEGPELKDMFGVSAFPTMVFFDAENNKVLHRIVGFRPAEELLNEAKSAPAKAKETDRLATAYNSNKKDVNATKAYLDNLMKARDPKAEEVALQYISLVPKSDWYKKENFAIISRYVSDPFSKEASYYFKNKQKFIDENGISAERFEYSLYSRYASSLVKVEHKEDFDQKAFDKLVKLMEGNEFNNIESIKDNTNRGLLLSVKDYSGYMDVVEEKFEAGLANSSQYHIQQGLGLLNPIAKCEDTAIYLRAADLLDTTIAAQFADEELQMLGMFVAYKVQYDFLQKAGVTGERLAVAKSMTDLFENITPKHRRLLDKTYEEAQKESGDDKPKKRAIPAMRMSTH